MIKLPYTTPEVSGRVGWTWCDWCAAIREPAHVCYREQPPFKPDWASPPGETIRDAMVEKNLSAHRLGLHLDLAPRDVRGLLAGRLRISAELAGLLARYVGGSQKFWIRREAHYRESLAARQQL